MRISNKKLFKQQIWIILVTIISIVLINVFFNDLCINGAESAFTINNYKEAFKTTSSDIKLFNLIRWTFIVCSIYFCKINLEYNKELADIEKEERILLRRVVSENV